MRGLESALMPVLTASSLRVLRADGSFREVQSPDLVFVLAAALPLVPRVLTRRARKIPTQLVWQTPAAYKRLLMHGRWRERSLSRFSREDLRMNDLSSDFQDENSFGDLSS